MWTTFGELAILYNCTRTASVKGNRGWNVVFLNCCPMFMTIWVAVACWVFLSPVVPHVLLLIEMLCLQDLCWKCLSKQFKLREPLCQVPAHKIWKWLHITELFLIFALIATSLFFFFFYCVNICLWLIQNVCFSFSMMFWSYSKPEKLMKPRKIYKYQKGCELIWWEFSWVTFGISVRVPVFIDFIHGNLGQNYSGAFLSV